MAERVRLCGDAEVAPWGMLRLDFDGHPPLAACSVDGRNVHANAE
jgi:hypothetical protein